MDNPNYLTTRRTTVGNNACVRTPLRWGTTLMSNYPDGMSPRDWAHIDGEEHEEDCPQHEDFQGINNLSECYCGIVIGEGDCECDCMCDTLVMSEYDIELERLGL